MALRGQKSQQENAGGHVDAIQEDYTAKAAQTSVNVSLPYECLGIWFVKIIDS